MASVAVIHTGYASPTYNPHSLSRRWGLFFSGRILNHLPNEQAPNRQTRAFRSQLAKWIQTDFQQSFLASASQTQAYHKITHARATASCPPDIAPVLLKDDISSLDDLVKETGIDVLALAVLADVPLNRPRNLELEDLVAQWRWLRLVWSHFSRPEGTPLTDRPSVAPSADVMSIARQIEQYRLNIALAELRIMFQYLQKAPANRQNALQLCFIELLRLFCPYIGHELLYRYGAIKSPDQTES
ncbi:hypothetical protein [Thalassospira profundimaris]|uniref:hypothetical protein n=1 Tax=Thalassospira profundimaris TaxID=502049 RepID=UPI0011BF4C5C|nr:hypothetical protein [Thalassospira profundimaris]